MVPRSQGTSQSLISRLQNREFCIAKETKMLFTFCKGCKQNKSKYEEDYVMETMTKILTIQFFIRKCRQLLFWS